MRKFDHLSPLSPGKVGVDDTDLFGCALTTPLDFPKFITQLQ